MAPGMKLSGLQKQVLGLYRGFLRAAQSKGPEERHNIESIVSSEFRHNAKSVDRKDFLHIEYLLRRGKKQLDQLKSPGTVRMSMHKARALQDDLDEQMTLYRRLVATKSDTSCNDVESGIDKSLKQLQQVNSQMQALISSGGSEFLPHTLTRHQEILKDLTQEFYRLRSSHRDKRERALLLHDFREFDKARFDIEANGSSDEQSLLKEHASLSRSTGQADTVISQAQATLSTLVIQRSTFGGIGSKISNVSSRLPTVNNILSAIKRKKSMDTLILSLVASACTFLILIYWLSK